MLAALNARRAGTIVVLHACCHNPTGYDLTPDAMGRRWSPPCKARGLVPFLDMAYQGFGDGIAEDGAAVGLFVAAGLDFFVATCFSKSFSLYGERVGALSVVCASEGRGGARAEPAEARDPHQLLQPADPRRAGRRRRADHARRCARCGKRSWPACACASSRCASRCVDKLKAAGVTQDMSFITRQQRHVQLLAA